MLMLAAGSIADVFTARTLARAVQIFD